MHYNGVFTIIFYGFKICYIKYLSVYKIVCSIMTFIVFVIVEITSQGICDCGDNVLRYA